MEVKYEIREIENASGTGVPRKFVRLQQPIMLTEKEIEEEIEHSCSITSSDLRGVFAALRKLISRELSYGNRVYIPEIGYLTLSAELNQQKEQKITGWDVFLSGINFRPVKGLFEEVQKNVRFVKAKTTSKSAEYTKEVLWQRIEEYIKENGFITTRDLRSDFALSRYKAEKWLAVFQEEGLLEKRGSWRSPVYFMKSKTV